MLPRNLRPTPILFLAALAGLLAGSAKGRGQHQPYYHTPTGQTVRSCQAAQAPQRAEIPAREYWAHHQDPLVRDLVAILHQTQSSDTFLITLALLLEREVDKERLVPVVICNAERVGIFGHSMLDYSSGSSRRELVEGLRGMLAEMANGKKKVPVDASLPVTCPVSTAPATGCRTPAELSEPQESPLPGTEEALPPQQAVPSPTAPPAPQPTPPPCGNPPTDEEVLRALPRTQRIPHLYEEVRDDVRIVKELVTNKIDPPRFYPLVGSARLHHRHWKCTVYFNETIRSGFPFPIRYTRPRVEVVYIDRDKLHLAAETPAY